MKKYDAFEDPEVSQRLNKAVKKHRAEGSFRIKSPEDVVAKRRLGKLSRIMRMEQEACGEESW